MEEKKEGSNTLRRKNNSRYKNNQQNKNEREAKNRTTHNSKNITAKQNNSAKTQNTIERKAKITNRNNSQTSRNSSSRDKRNQARNNGRERENKRDNSRHNNFRMKRSERVKLPELTCSLCSKKIEDQLNAINNAGTNEPLHFDCALKYLKGIYSPKEEEEKIRYIGGGEFIISNGKKGEERAVLVKVNHEEQKQWPEWRVGMRSPVVENVLVI